MPAKKLRALRLSKKSFLVLFGCCCTPVLLRKPIENCLRAVRHGPHFVQSTKPQFSGVAAFQESGRYAQLQIEVQPVKKRGFPLAGNAGRAVWPASGFSGVRILSGHRGSCPLHSRQPFKKGWTLNFLCGRFLRDFGASISCSVPEKIYIIAMQIVH